MKKRLLSVVLVLIVILGSLTFSVSAAEPTINASASAGSVNVGETVNVVIKLNHPDTKLIGAEATVEFSSNFEFSSAATSVGEIDFNKISNTKVKILLDLDSAQKNLTITLKFKAKTSGTGSFKVTATGETEDSDKTTTSTLNVKVVDKTALPSNANASSIVIKPTSAGKLVPDFKPDITSYNVNVDYSVTEVLLSVVAQDNKAKISIEGSKNMKVGANTRTVVIEAQNGTVKKYTINIYRAASNDTTTDPTPPITDPTDNLYEIKVGERTKYMVQNYDDIELPIGFSPAVHTINDTEVPVLKDIVNDRIIVYATDENGENGVYCLYNEAKKTFSQFRYMWTDGFKFIVLDYNDTIPTLKNYFYTIVSVGEFSVNGFKYNDASMSNFVIFYAETINGEKGFYRYDAKDNTVQIAVEFNAEYNNALVSDDKDSKDVIARFMELRFKNKAILISGVLVVLLSVILVIVIIVKVCRKGPKISIESLEAASEKKFMEGVSGGTRLFLDNDYENDNLVMDDDFKLKDDNS